MQQVINEMKTGEQQPEPLTDQIMEVVKEEEKSKPKTKAKSKAKSKPNQNQELIYQSIDKVITVEQPIEEVKPKSRAKKPKTNNTIPSPVEESRKDEIS